jgi:hypothetical protein
VSYLEEQQGLAPSKYSAEFLEIDAQAGPWLTASQQDSIITKGHYEEWDFNLEEGLIRFKTKEQIGVVAQVQLLGTYSPENGLWLWAWSNPKLLPHCQLVTRLRDEHPDLPEFNEAAHPGNETKAWALAAAAAYSLKAEGCFRLTGEIYTFVALFGVTDLTQQPGPLEGDEAQADPEQAFAALAEYAGPMVMNLGGLLISSLQHDGLGLDQIIEALHSFCENLEELSRSPLGQGTPAGAEALELAAVLRQGTLCLSLPPGAPELAEGIQEMLGLFKDVAMRYGAWQKPSDSD